MPTFSARLYPKSHFPGPNTGIVFGLFLLLFKDSNLYKKTSGLPSSLFYPIPPLLIPCSQFVDAIFIFCSGFK